MRNAPPVNFPVGRFVLGSRMVLVLSALSMVVCWLAWRASGTSAFYGGLWAAVWTIVLMVSCWCVVREALPPGQLQWDGAAWQFEAHVEGHSGTTEQVQLSVCLDWGRAMLLRVQADGKSTLLARFAWIKADAMPSAWHGCRCAVYGNDIF